MEQFTNRDQGSSEAGGVVERMRSGAKEQLASRKERATEGLGSIARAIRQSSQPLRENQQDALAQYVEDAAAGLERFSARLRERDVSELVGDAQRLARRQPALFVGAAFATGILAARFLKSSSDRGAEYEYGGRGYGGPSPDLDRPRAGSSSSSGAGSGAGLEERPHPSGGL